MNKGICHSCSLCGWSHSGSHSGATGPAVEFGDGVRTKETAGAPEHWLG